MPTSESSASAYERLRLLSQQADHAATVSFEYTKLMRTLQALRDDLKLTMPVPVGEITEVEKMLSTVAHNRAVWRDYAEGKQTACTVLNEKIQNGVYNDETR